MVFSKFKGILNMDMFGDNKVVPDFEYRFDKSLPYLHRHFKRNWFMRIFFRLCKKQIWNLLHDAANTGWGICSNQVANRHNPIYWDKHRSDGNIF